MIHTDLLNEARKLVASRVTPDMTPEQKDDLLERTMMELLDRKVPLPWFARVGLHAAGGPAPAGSKFLMHHEPRLPPMPDKPSLMDFYKRRILLNKRGGSHLLQSAALAKRNGLPEKIILACLLHDIAVVSFIRTDHGHFGAQMIEPYVDPEVTWAVKYHQALRFYPDPEHGYEYPDLYVRVFGEDYEPPEYIRHEYEYARSHKWYMSARLVTMNDLYAFDPDAVVHVEEFEDIIARNWRHPPEGLGFDGSPVAHMWRSLIWPNNFL